MSRSFPPPRSRPRSPTARALEIVRLTRRQKAYLAEWPFSDKSPGSSFSPANATPRSGGPTWPRLTAPGARSEAKGAANPVLGVPQPPSGKNAPATSPGDPGYVPLPPSTPYREA